jgi:hypothetical protein
VLAFRDLLLSTDGGGGSGLGGQTTPAPDIVRETITIGILLGGEKLRYKKWKKKYKIYIFPIFVYFLVINFVGKQLIQ